MDLSLEKLLAQVVDQPTFLAFVDALASDFADHLEAEAESPSAPYGPGALGWENGSVDTFLDAALRWGTDTLGDATHDVPGCSPWRRFAQILYAGKYYE